MKRELAIVALVGAIFNVGCGEQAQQPEATVASVAATEAAEPSEPQIPKLTKDDALVIVGGYVDRRSMEEARPMFGNLVVEEVTLVEPKENRAKVYFRGTTQLPFQFREPGTYRWNVTLTWDGEAWQVGEFFLLN